VQDFSEKGKHSESCGRKVLGLTPQGYDCQAAAQGFVVMQPVATGCFYWM
jgi:hypothetical protein